MNLRASSPATVLLAVFLAAIGGLYAWYRIDLAAAERGIATGSAIADTTAGPVEYADTSAGRPLLVLHGAGGGFDQGLLVAGQALPAGFRLLAPSRFGYLRTPLPGDASAERQAAAHAALLDALAVKRAVVVGICAGTPSAVAFARAYPERTAALIMISPAAFSTERPAAEPTWGNRLLLGVVMQGSDLAFWMLKRFAYSMVVRFVGVEPALYESAPAAERAKIDAIIEAVMPLRRRLPGMLNDGAVIEATGRYRLHELTVPVLLLCARDDLLADCNEAERWAEAVPAVRRTVFASGGHLLLGRGQETQAAIAQFLAETGQEHPLTSPQAR
ncbi:MAG: alpha/beta hydrolase [Bradyrhizobiaceae bacterium]|nr:alpha/beta hydrolase [Bradyrhizobiaceae bacterium]